MFTKTKSFRLTGVFVQKKHLLNALLLASILFLGACSKDETQRTESAKALLSLADDGDIMQLDESRSGEWWLHMPNQTFQVYDGESETYTIQIDYENGISYVEEEEQTISYPIGEIFNENLTDAAYAKLTLVEHYIATDAATLLEEDQYGNEKELNFNAGHTQGKKSCGALNVRCWLKELQDNMSGDVNSYKRQATRFANEAVTEIDNLFSDIFSPSNFNKLMAKGRSSGWISRRSDLVSGRALLQFSTAQTYNYKVDVKQGELKFKFEIEPYSYDGSSGGAKALIIDNQDGSFTIPSLEFKMEAKLMLKDPLGIKVGPKIGLKDFTFYPANVNKNTLDVGSVNLGLAYDLFVESKFKLKIKIGSIKKTIGKVKVVIAPLTWELGTSISNWDKPQQLIKNAGVTIEGYSKLELELGSSISRSVKVEWPYFSGTLRYFL